MTRSRHYKEYNVATAIYNDTETGPWIGQLMQAGLVMPGHVDTRSIAGLRSEDLAFYTRVHLFAGIGGWDLALQLAGWPDDAEVWTGSCPCQPFSTAGKQKGTTDDRHLWPEMRRLIAERSPTVVFGENVASRAGRAWLAGVRADLEAMGYAVGAADLCAASVGAPHIRQRIYWGAYRLGHANGEGRTRQPLGLLGSGNQGASWDDYELLALRDGTHRRTQRGLFPLADGVSSGMVPSSHHGMAGHPNATAQARPNRLRGYGNAVVPQVSAAFIRAFMASVTESRSNGQ